MKQHEREYFISRIRTGIYFIKSHGLELRIFTPTILQEYQANEIYIESYYNAINDEIKTEEQMLLWMMEKEFWTTDDEIKLNGIKKDIEKLKIEIFNARNNSSLKEKVRIYLREAEKFLKKHLEKKNLYYTNTCEYIASLDKSFFLLKNCTYLNEKLYDFNLLPLDEVWYKYCSFILPESESRELARNEPWKSLWFFNKDKITTLFQNTDRELSIDQKNLIIWSKMYDNIQESIDYPTQDVIEDDDMLDGWFLIQRDKKEKERSEKEFENSNVNQKIKNSDEIFIMSNNKLDSQRINNMNNLNEKIIKKQRIEIIKKKGGASQLDFPDEKIKLTQQSNQGFKQKFRR